MLTKMVNGVEVVMSAEEETAVRAEWSNNAVAAATYEATLGYRDKREKAYPKMGDQLDAIYKGFKTLVDAEISVGEDATAWISALDAVKALYPKPS